MIYLLLLRSLLYIETSVQKKKENCLVTSAQCQSQCTPPVEKHLQTVNCTQKVTSAQCESQCTSPVEKHLQTVNCTQVMLASHCTYHGQPHAFVVIDDVGQKFGGCSHRDSRLVPQLIHPATQQSIRLKALLFTSFHHHHQFMLPAIHRLQNYCGSTHAPT